MACSSEWCQLRQRAAIMQADGKPTTLTWVQVLKVFSVRCCSGQQKCHMGRKLPPLE